MFWLLFTAAHAATYVVDQSGGADFLTISDAFAVVQLGDTVEIRAGIYDESGIESDVEGLHIVGDGPTATIMLVQPDQAGLSFKGNLDIEGIGFQGTGNEGIGIDYIKTFSDGTEVGSIHNCRFDDLYIAAEFGDYFDTVYIYDNVVNNVYVGFVTGWQPAHNLHIENNLFGESMEGAIRLESKWADYPGTHHVITHNTFVGSTIGIARYAEETSFASMEVTGNIFVDGNVGLTLAYDQGDELSNNIYYNLSRSLLYHVSSVTTEYNNIEVDPEFCDQRSSLEIYDMDLRLRTGSPAIDAATADLISLLGVDRDGVTRPLDGDGDGDALPDPGAYEFDPDNPCTPVDPGDTGAPDTGATIDTAPPPDTGPVDTDAPPVDTAPPKDTAPTDTQATGTAPGDDPSDPDDPPCGCSDKAGVLLLLPLGLWGRRRSRARKIAAENPSSGRPPPTS